MEFYDAYHFLKKYPIFKGHFSQCLDMYIVKVDPLTKRIEDDAVRNTETNVWLECGPWVLSPYEINFVPAHDISLDCGGDTFEEAICRLADLVAEHESEYMIDNTPPELSNT